MALVRLEIRDRDFTLLEILDNEFTGLSWDYNRIGGCGSFRFSLARNFCDEKYISGDFNIRIYVRNDSTKAYDLWYQGVVESKMPDVKDDEQISVTGHGYQAQLSRIYPDSTVTYTGQEISVIVKAILDNYITANTDITYDVGDIVSTGITLDSWKFSTSALDAFQTLADIAGTREWGVDKDRKFFFKARSSSIGYRFPLGGQVTAFNSDDSFKDIVNRIIVQGGDVSDVPFTATFNDSASQLKYGLRTQVIQNSSIVTSAVAEQFADSIFTEKSDVVRKGSCELVDYEAQIEATIPIPLFAIKARPVLYGEKYYGTFLYSGEISYQVNRVSYRYTDAGDIVEQLELGKLRPNISEAIGKIEYDLEQLRTAGV